MNATIKRKKQAKVLRIFRKVHRLLGAFLFIFFFIIAVSGLFLGWKKNSGGIILAETKKGTSGDLSKWLPLEVLYNKANDVVSDSIHSDKVITLDRVDIHKDKGVIKIITAYNWMVLQEIY